MSAIKAFAATQAGGELEPFEYDPGELGRDEVEIKISHCGICHSDLSMLKNDWGMSSYPFVPGHEGVGEITATGENVTHLHVGQTVGLGWWARSCLTCAQCLSGDHNLCLNAVGTIVGRHGAFADRVRAQSAWVVPLPDGIDVAKAGPLLCGGITVFNPLLQFGVSPTSRVGVVGIGGLGHLALKFLRAWGCEVWAFTTSPDKAEEAKRLGAHKTANTRDEAGLAKLAGAFDLILSTVNAALPWDAYIAMLKPRGRLHTVGATPPLEFQPFPMILGQKSVSGSPVGGPQAIAVMLDFCARHGIAPQTEIFKMDQVNDAFEHLEAGKARYRIVLEN